MKGENARTDSISSPKNSTRSGSRPVVGNTSTMPPRTANWPRSSDALDALVAGERKRLGERLDARLETGPHLDRRGPRLGRRQTLRERARRRAHEPAALEDVERPRALADEVRRRGDARLPRHAAARQQSDRVVTEEPRRRVRRVARVRILRQKHDEPAPERLVKRREERRQSSLRDTRACRQRVRERGDALVLDELANYGVKYRTVHDERRNRRFRGNRWYSEARPRTLKGHMRGVAQLGPLRERPFRLLWLGRTGSAVGDSMIPVALIWTVSQDLHASLTWVGIVLACNLVGGASFTLAGGVWADRLPRRAVMIAADLTRLGTQGTTAALLFSGTAHVWQIAVLQGIAGAAAGFFNPASTALIPQSVSAERLQQANALVATSQSAAGSSARASRA